MPHEVTDLIRTMVRDGRDDQAISDALLSRWPDLDTEEAARELVSARLAAVEPASPALPAGWGKVPVREALEAVRHAEAETRPFVPAAFVPIFPPAPEQIFKHEYGKPIRLPRGLLPAPIEGLAFELEEKHGVDAVVFSWFALSIVGALLGNRRRLRVSSDQTVRGNLFVAVVANPAGMKTPMMQWAARPAVWLEKQIRERLEEDQRTFERKLLIWEVEKAQLQKRLKSASGQEREEIAERLQDGAPTPPVFPQILISDATVEALIKGLQDNPNGVILFVDELQFLLNQTNKKGFETYRQILLEFFETHKPFSDNRLSRKGFFVPAPVISIAGGIQEAKAERFVGASEDGLVERVLFAVPEIKPWVDHDDPVDSDLENAYFRAVIGIPGTDPGKLGYEHDEDHGFWFTRFDSEAQGLWRSWRNFTEEVKRLHIWEGRPKLQGWFGKLRTLGGKFALIIHATEGRPGAVGIETLSRAIMLSVVAFSHAEAGFGRFGGESGENPDPPEVLLFELLKNEETESFRAKDIYHRDRAGLGKEAVEKGILALQAAGWLCPERLNAKGGRPSIRYHVNPKIDKALLGGLVGSFWQNQVETHFLRIFEKYALLGGLYKKVLKSNFNKDYYYINNKSIDFPTVGENSDQNNYDENKPTKPPKYAEDKLDTQGPPPWVDDLIPESDLDGYPPGAFEEE